MPGGAVRHAPVWPLRHTPSAPPPRHPRSQVYFLPNDPFAICVCPGNEDNPPRLIWFNMQTEKLIAELSGKTDNGFGMAGLAALPPHNSPEGAPAGAVGRGEAVLRRRCA